MPNVPKNRRRSKKLEGDDARSEEIKTERVEVTAPVKIISLAISANHNFYGLGDDGFVYKFDLYRRTWSIQ